MAGSDPEASSEAPAETTSGKAQAPGPRSSDHFIVKLCGNGSGYQVNPADRSLKLDLARAKEILIGVGFTPLVDAGVMLILKRECELNLYSSGRLLVRLDDIHQATKLADELAGLLY